MSAGRESEGANGAYISRITPFSGLALTEEEVKLVSFGGVSREGIWDEQDGLDDGASVLLSWGDGRERGNGTDDVGCCNESALASSSHSIRSPLAKQKD